MYDTYIEVDELEYMIEELRYKMIQSALITGLNSHKTISYSQRLDQLIMTYQNKSLKIN